MCAEGVLWAVAAGFLTKAGEPTCAIGDTQQDTRLGFLTIAHVRKRKRCPHKLPLLLLAGLASVRV